MAGDEEMSDVWSGRVWIWNAQKIRGRGGATVREGWCLNPLSWWSWVSTSLRPYAIVGGRKVSAIEYIQAARKRGWRTEVAHRGMGILFAAIGVAALLSAPALAGDDTAKAGASVRNLNVLAYIVAHPEKICELTPEACKPGWEERLARCQAATKWADVDPTSFFTLCDHWKIGEALTPAAKSAEPPPAQPVRRAGETSLCARRMTRDGCQSR